MAEYKKVLIAPLNWGLGHASRSIAIIHQLLKHNKEIYLASDGPALNLLNKEFPMLPSVELPSYDINYKSGSMVLNILSQLPKIYWAYNQEKKFIRKFVKEHGIEVIISDNRYGCLHPDTLNIVICHQIQLQSKSRIFRWLGRKTNLKLLNRFDCCWIPDTDNNHFAGDLSSSLGLNKYEYIGPLSRLKHREAESKYEIIAILSGPEPERTKFEKKLITQLSEAPFQSVVVRGTNKKKADNRIYRNIDIYNLLSGFDLNKLISRSKHMISRSGYSTIMDLYFLKKKAILIPTNGQTEQEYLAEYLKKEAAFYSCKENELDISDALSKLNVYPGFTDVVVTVPDFDELIKKLIS